MSMDPIIEALENQDNNRDVYSIMSFEERFAIAVDECYAAKNADKTRRLIHSAKLRYPNADINTLYYEGRSINKNELLSLGTCGFVDSKTNLIINGFTGSGKTHLACAIGKEACRHLHRTRYIRMPEMLEMLNLAEETGHSITNAVTKLSNYHVLIIDEWLLDIPSEIEVKYLLEIFERRYDQWPTIFCSQYKTTEWLTFSSYGILRGVNGGLMHSPFIAGILFLLSLGAGITGMAYGFSSGRYRTDNDVIEGLTQPMKLLGVYFVIAFFAAQMFACFEYSHLDKCLAIMGADLLSSFEPAPLSALVLFILFTALINLIMVSATSKWAFMSFIFIPMFAQMGIAPDIAQCAFRIGDSSTNAITPFLFYMPLVLTYMRQYDKQITYGSLLKYTWRYSLGILVVWTLLFIVWYLLKIPMGL